MENSRLSPRSTLTLFIGMVYAAMLHLVMANADEHDAFTATKDVFLFLPLLIFFAHDWLNRSIANHIAPFSREPNTWVLLKLAVDVAVVYFLFLASLAVVDLLGASPDTHASMASELFLRVGWLSIASWIWNLVVIWNARLLDTRDRAFILTLVLPRDLLSQYFPQIGQWQKEMEHAFVQIDIAARGTKTVLDGGLLRTNAAHIRASALVVVRGLHSAHKVMIPYCLLVKLLLLDLILGVILILVHKTSGPNTLLDIPLWLLGSTGLIAVAMYSWHLSPRPATEQRFERASAIVLCVFATMAYASVPPSVLVGFFVAQQFLVGQVMLLQFTPPPTRPSGNSPVEAPLNAITPAPVA